MVNDADPLIFHSVRNDAMRNVLHDVLYDLDLYVQMEAQTLVQILQDHL